MQRNGDIDEPDFGAAIPQSEAEWQHHSPSALLPYASILPPVAPYNAGWHLAQGMCECDPMAAARGGCGAAGMGGAGRVPTIRLCTA
jgi:hypothetical protein